MPQHMEVKLMKLERLVGERFKERPADCIIDSHGLMIRGGYMKYVANGIFSSYTVLRRITRKIEQIIREEMDAIDGQEVLFPVVMPASLWLESGRFESVGSELLRFHDRNESPMVLGMTHEEAAVHLVREYGKTYTKYPFMIYQIQTKFRDEARPRGGLIRVREFTMKDAYSFHTSQEDLNAFYERCFHAYERIFSRAGIPETIAVASDSGMMGGSISHEFMLLTPIGEDSIVICERCDYRANMEAAESIVVNKNAGLEGEFKKIYTPDAKTIEDVCNFLNYPIENSCKAVIYQKNATDEYIVVFIRGDLDVNETKLRNFLQEEIHPAVITDESGLSAGFIGPVGLEDINILFDGSLKGVNNLCCGANEVDHHYIGFQIKRDFAPVDYYDFAKVIEGGICPQCGNSSLKVSRGIEVGNIFQLGVKYTKSMNMHYVDENGNPHYPIMGCYGVGVDRLAASVCEAHHDEHGPIWPMSIAPWQVHICAIRIDNPNVSTTAIALYNDLINAGVEVIYDDRNVRAGVMFSDADLLGVPVRVVISPKTYGRGVVEISMRDKSISCDVPIQSVVEYIQIAIYNQIASLSML